MRAKLIRVVALVAVAVSATAGCAASKVPPDANVTLHGRLVHQDGSPAAGLKVGLTRLPDIGEVLTQGFGIMFSVGLACLADRPPPACKLWQTTRSDGDGAFAFHMTGHDVRGSFNRASHFTVYAALPANDEGGSGPSVQSSFLIQRADLGLPEFVFWEPGELSATADPTEIGVRWDDFPGRQQEYSVHFTVGDSPVWSAKNAKSGSAIDARAVEDVEGWFHVTAHVDHPGPDTKFQTLYSSQRVRFTGRAGAPPSRGRDCYRDGGDGPQRLSPCTLTDGVFGQPYPPPDTSQQCPTGTRCKTDNWVYVDLGSASRVGTVFAHGLVLHAEVAIETSDDAVTWTRRETVRRPDNFLRVSLDEPVTARYVRLRAPDDGTIDELSELSVWS